MVARRATGTLDALFDPSNGRVVMDNLQMGKKYAQAKVHYKIPTKRCEILGDSAVGGLCDTGAQPAEQSIFVDITKRAGIQPKFFDNNQMIKICQDTDAFIKEYMVSDMNAMKEYLNDALLALLAAGTGRNHRWDGTVKAENSAQSLTLLGTSTDTGQQVPIFSRFAELGLDYAKNKRVGVPNLIGEGILSKFWQLQKYSCCNASGIDYNSAIAESGNAFWLDHGANRILGNNKFLVVAPNVAHVLLFNRNTNININNELVRHTVIPDTDYPQLKYDFDFKWDECNKYWIYTLSVDFDLFTPPTDQFGAGDLSSPVCEDDAVGVTGIFSYQAA